MKKVMMILCKSKLLVTWHGNTTRCTKEQPETELEVLELLSLKHWYYVQHSIDKSQWIMTITIIGWCYVPCKITEALVKKKIVKPITTVSAISGKLSYPDGYELSDKGRKVLNESVS